jgi:hypothetical protein
MQLSIVGRVISKNDHGIIVYCAAFIGPAHPESGTVVFVEGDYSNLADEDGVNLKCIETGGTYQYTAVSGAAKTLRAFREDTPAR